MPAKKPKVSSPISEYFALGCFSVFQMLIFPYPLVKNGNMFGKTGSGRLDLT
jgi:hypothetical protein